MMTVEFKSQEIVVQLADGTEIKGKIRVRGSSGLGDTRLSDQINTDDYPFIILFDVDCREELGKVLFINKSHIVWISPLDFESTS